MKKANAWALLPIGIFVVLYLGLGIVFEYVLKIPMGFYSIPIVVIFLIALLVACIQNPKRSFDEKLVIMGNGVGDKDIVTMILIFLTAGIFVGTVGRESAQSVAYFMLSVIPAQYAVAVLFLVSCFVSLAMGTSVGTITLITPIAAEVARASGFPAALCVGSVMGGAMFGDNLSIISDTTIAAVRTQGCEMRDKFRMNFWIVLPAAVLTFILLIVVTPSADTALTVGEYNLMKVLPYLVVLVGALVGVNVFVILIAGTVLALGVGVFSGAFVWTECFNVLYNGIYAMYDITVISVIVACIGALVRDAGGIDALIHLIRSRIHTRRGAQIGVAALVMGVDIATANNTIAIVMSGPIAKEIAQEFDITPKQTASLLDIFAAVMQGILPYGAQLLYAVGGAAAAGYAISSVHIIPYLYYPFLMGLCALAFVLVGEKLNKK